jgi:TP901-1 family phage major tail protein
MAAQAGRDLLLKLDGAGDGAFTTVAGLRARRISLTAGSIDVTDSDSPGRWRELLGGAGVRRASLSGGGLFKDAAADEMVRQVFFAGLNRPWRVVVPDFGTLTGPFHLATLEYAGTHDGELTFEMALESAGALAFEAA